MQTTGAEATSAPRGGMALDADALLRYMRHAMAAQLPPGVRALRVRQFGHGQSNPTYLVSCVADAANADATALASFVLRKKPPVRRCTAARARVCSGSRQAAALHQTRACFRARGVFAAATHARAPLTSALALLARPSRCCAQGKLLSSAHAVEREHAVLSALARATPRVPVPAVYALCTDDAVLGTPFYVMQHVVGRCVHRAPAGMMRALLRRARAARAQTEDVERPWHPPLSSRFLRTDANACAHALPSPAHAASSWTLRCPACRRRNGAWCTTLWQPRWLRCTLCRQTLPAFLRSAAAPAAPRTRRARWSAGRRSTRPAAARRRRRRARRWPRCAR
jgi:hypothetical protein